MLYCTILYCTVRYCTVLYYYVILYHIILYCIVLYFYYTKSNGGDVVAGLAVAGATFAEEAEGLLAEAKAQAPGPPCLGISCLKYHIYISTFVYTHIIDTYVEWLLV